MKKGFAHVVIPKGQHYDDARILHTVSWDKTTNTFSVIFADNYWDYFKDKSDREIKLYQMVHRNSLVSALDTIMKTGDWPDTGE